MKRALICVVSLLAGSVTGLPQAAGGSGGQIVDEPPPPRQPVLSPPAKTAVTINGRKIVIHYSAPSMRKRLIFGGLEPYYKVWRAGANDATALDTAADLEVEGLRVPKGKYTLYVWLDPKQWLLIINKQTGQSGLEYHQERDLGRVPMTMSKPLKPVETYQMTLTHTTDNEGRVTLAWENTIAAVTFRVENAK